MERNEHEETELSMLFSMIDERNADLEKQMREQIESRRSIQRTLEQQEAERLRDVNSSLVRPDTYFWPESRAEDIRAKGISERETTKWLQMD